jgi:peptide/nickel transport system permease protein
MAVDAVAQETPRFRLMLTGRWSWLPGNVTLLVGGLIVGGIIGLSLLAPWISPYDPVKPDYGVALLPPGPGHLFGTDNFGRDIFTRTLYAARIDLQLGFFSVVFAWLLGNTLGLLAGFFGGRVDTLVMRLVDTVVAFPFLVLQIGIVAMLGPGVKNMYIGLTLVGWTAYTRLIRGEILVVRKLEYMDAARALGFRPGRQILRHALPNVVTPTITFAMSDMVLCILSATALSFLGLGVQPPDPEWGQMITEGKTYLAQQWWMVTFPGLAIVLTGIGLSLLGDGIADRLRPK